MSKFVHGNVTLDEMNKIRDLIAGTADDRTCGIIAGAFLDNLLYDLLDQCLVESPFAKRSTLFQFGGPLSGFAAKIQIAHFAGLISLGDAASLNAIKDIRNLCAHSVGVKEDQIVDFDHATVVKLLKEFYPSRALSKFSKSDRAKFEGFRDATLEALGGRQTFLLFFCHVALSLWARIQTTRRFQIPEEFGESDDLPPGN